jgi:hypothetical protein
MLMQLIYETCEFGVIRKLGKRIIDDVRVQSTQNDLVVSKTIQKGETSLVIT